LVAARDAANVRNVAGFGVTDFSVQHVRGVVRKITSARSPRWWGSHWKWNFEQYV